LDHLVTSTIHGAEVRLVVGDPGGDSLYSGHKRGVGGDVLRVALHYYYDRLKSRFLFVDYCKWDERYGAEPIRQDMTGCLFEDGEPSRGLLRSYETLLDLAGRRFGNFKKISFVKS